MYQKQDIDPLRNGKDWLLNNIEAFQDNSSIQLPKKSNGADYDILETNDEQRHIVTTVIDTIVKWISGSSDYKPLRMTVSAGAGRGKSYIIHQLTAAIKRMFNRNDVVLTTAFTGAAAFNINGSTCHSSFGISTTNPNDELSAANKQRMIEALRYIVAILIDERSMLPAAIFGAIERNVSVTCHGGGKQFLDWGGVPVVIILGDDFQLPPVDMGQGKGAFYCLTPQSLNQRNRNVELSGMLQFLKFSKNVFTISKHQRTNQLDFINLQDRIREGKPIDEDYTTLESLNFYSLTTTLQHMIEKNPTTMHLFATRKKCYDFNLMNLFNDHSDDNPVAIIKSKLSKYYKKNDDSVPKITTLCREAKVSIKGRNFCPKNGLFNGAIGTVVEIVYNQGESPNTGHFPQYVLVDFPTYSGPTFILRILHGYPYHLYIWSAVNLKFNSSRSNYRMLEPSTNSRDIKLVQRVI